MSDTSVTASETSQYTSPTGGWIGNPAGGGRLVTASFLSESSDKVVLLNRHYTSSPSSSF